MTVKSSNVQLYIVLCSNNELQTNHNILRSADIYYFGTRFLKRTTRTNDGEGGLMFTRLRL